MKKLIWIFWIFNPCIEVHFYTNQCIYRRLILFLMSGQLVTINFDGKIVCEHFWNTLQQWHFGHLSLAASRVLTEKTWTVFILGCKHVPVRWKLTTWKTWLFANCHACFSKGFRQFLSQIMPHLNCIYQIKFL